MVAQMKSLFSFAQLWLIFAVLSLVSNQANATAGRVFKRGGGIAYSYEVDPIGREDTDFTWQVSKYEKEKRVSTDEGTFSVLTSRISRAVKNIKKDPEDRDYYLYRTLEYFRQIEEIGLTEGAARPILIQYLYDNLFAVTVWAHVPELKIRGAQIIHWLLLEELKDRPKNPKLPKHLSIEEIKSKIIPILELGNCNDAIDPSPHLPKLPYKH